jgi:hypothetical protein
MPNRKPIEIRPAKGPDAGWEVARQSSSRPLSKHRSQQAAINKGRPIAKRERTEFVVKAKTGRIRDRASYGNDPRGRG